MRANLNFSDLRASARSQGDFYKFQDSIRGWGWSPGWGGEFGIDQNEYNTFTKSLLSNVPSDYAVSREAITFSSSTTPIDKTFTWDPLGSSLNWDPSAYQGSIKLVDYHPSLSGLETAAIRAAAAAAATSACWWAGPFAVGCGYAGYKAAEYATTAHMNATLNYSFDPSLAFEMPFTAAIKGAAAKIGTTYSVYVTAPDPDKIMPGVPFDVKTSPYSISDSLIASGPKFDLGISFGVDFSLKSNVNIDYEYGTNKGTSKGNLSIANFDVSGSPDWTILSPGSFSLTNSNNASVFKIAANDEELTWKLEPGDGNKAVLVSTENLIALTLDIDDALGLLYTPLKQLDGDVELKIPGIKLGGLGIEYNFDLETKLEWTILGVNAELAISPVIQVVESNPTLNVTLIAPWGEVKNGKVGDSFTFTAPSDWNDMRYDYRFKADYTYSSDIKYVPGVRITPKLPITVLNLEGSLLGQEFALEDLTGTDPYLPPYEIDPIKGLASWDVYLPDNMAFTDTISIQQHGNAEYWI